MASITLPLAFAAGLLSFLSPCVLSLVPVYMSYLSGSSVAGGALPRRSHILANALVFVAGFSVTLIILIGLPTTILGTMVFRYGTWITRIGGAILILFGLHAMRIITIPLLAQTRQLDLRTDRAGYARSALFGLTFAASWTPCVGPLLGTVMTLAFTEPSQAIGAALAYAAGLALPFLLTAAMLSQALGWLARFRKHLRTVEILSGLLMAGIGILLLTDQFSRLNAVFIRLTPDWLLQYL